MVPGLSGTSWKGVQQVYLAQGIAMSHRVHEQKLQTEGEWKMVVNNKETYRFSSQYFQLWVTSFKGKAHEIQDVHRKQIKVLPALENQFLIDLQCNSCISRNSINGGDA